MHQTLIRALCCLTLVCLGWSAPAAACTDPYEFTGENLTRPVPMPSVPGAIGRSLCGFYDGDYVSFFAAAGVRYRIELTGYSQERSATATLSIFHEFAPGEYRFVSATEDGVLVYETAGDLSGKLIVNVSDLATRLGQGPQLGDYTLNISVAGSANPGAAVSSLALSPNQVRGGLTSRGAVTLSAPAPVGGARVQLSSSNAAAAVPASVTVPEGQTTAAFTITTQRVRSNATALIRAAYNGSSVSAALVVTKR